jgi:hypothetical protein
MSSSNGYLNFTYHLTHSALAPLFAGWGAFHAGQIARIKAETYRVPHPREREVRTDYR